MLITPALKTSQLLYTFLDKMIDLLRDIIHIIISILIF